MCRISALDVEVNKYWNGQQCISCWLPFYFHFYKQSKIQQVNVLSSHQSINWPTTRMISIQLMRAMLKKAKDKTKKFISLSRSSRLPTNQSILMGQSAPTTHFSYCSSTNTSDQVGVTHPLPDQLLLRLVVTGTPLLSRSLQTPPSTPAQEDDRALPRVLLPLL
jgi:Zn-finger protein